MGDRVHVFLESSSFPNPIEVYSFSAGEEVYDPVKEILATSSCIGDSAYLTAQIINAVFTSLGYDGKLSFGVSSVADPYEAASWADNPSMYVNLDDGSYQIGDDLSDRFGNPR